jgi:DNA-binding transcriptional ArsR family regulator
VGHLLDAVRAEIEPLQARLDALREIERLTAALDAGEGGGGAGTNGSSEEHGRSGNRTSRRQVGASPAPARPVPARRSSSAGGDLGAKTETVLNVLRERDDWMSVSEIAAALDDGAPPDTLRTRLQSPVRRGLVEARGQTSQRRYRATGTPPKPPSTRRPETVRREVREKRDEVLAAVGEHGPASFALLVEATGLGRGQLLNRLQELAKAGHVTQNRDASWQTIASKDAEVAQRNGLPVERKNLIPTLRRRALAAITADPGALTEQRLGETLGADREDIALACGDLLVDGEIALAPDGTYSTSRQGGVPRTSRAMSCERRRHER